MTINKHITILLIGLFGVLQIVAQDEEKKDELVKDFQIELEFEYRYFMDEGRFPGQEQSFPSFATTPEYNLSWKDGYENINMKGFFRLDIDDHRTHWDIRELYYQKVKNKWELNLGLKKVYWGVTESNHLVDIINQTDVVESFDGEKKLGQPMAQFSYITDKIGTFNFFYLPYHRKRTFPGEKGRLRFPVIIERDDITYESGAEEWHQDAAIRWKYYKGIFDVGVSHFYGTGREPLLVFGATGALEAYYPIINQTGLEFQATINELLLKAEYIYRSSEAQDFTAIAAGFEYTFGNIKGSGVDVGILSEYLYDSRDDLSLTGLENDVFVGSRIAFNDVQSTQILIGGIADLEKTSKVLSIEASRRLGETFKMELEGRLFSDIGERELILSNFQDDSFIRLTVFKYF